LFVSNDKVSQEEHLHDPIYSGLRISGMALSNQSKLTGFFHSWKVNLKISRRILSNPASSEDDLPTLA
jgi:hypothetical protein